MSRQAAAARRCPGHARSRAGSLPACRRGDARSDYGSAHLTGRRGGNLESGSLLVIPPLSTLISQPLVKPRQNVPSEIEIAVAVAERWPDVLEIFKGSGERD